MERTKAEMIQALYRNGWSIRCIKALTNMNGEKIGRIIRQKQKPQKRSTEKRKVKRDQVGRFTPGTTPGPGRPPIIPLPPEPPFLQPDGKIDPHYLYPKESLL